MRDAQETSCAPLFHDVDDAYDRAHSMRCRSTFGRAVEFRCGDASYRVRKDHEGRVVIYRGAQPMDDDRLTALPDHEAQQLRSAYERLQVHDELRVELGPDSFLLRLDTRAAQPDECFATIAGIRISIAPSTALPDGEPHSAMAVLKLRRYLTLWEPVGDELTRRLRQGAERRPDWIEDLDLFSRCVFGADSRRERGQLIVNVWPGCNNNCVFCCALDVGRPRSVDAFRAGLARQTKTLDPARWSITFSGGEPTLHPEFEAVLALGRELGFWSRKLQTNAVLLAAPEKAKAVHRAGVSDLLISLHSHRKEHYDRLTNTRGNLPKVMAAVQNLARYPFGSMAFNFVVNRVNYRDFPDCTRWVANLRPHLRTQVSLVASALYMDPGDARWPELGISHAQIAPMLSEAARRHPLLISRQEGDCATPACFLRGYLSTFLLAANQRSDAQTVYLDEPRRASMPRGARIKSTRCQKCTHNPVCGGVCGAYAMTFGLDELAPAPAAKTWFWRMADRLMRTPVRQPHG